MDVRGSRRGGTGFVLPAMDREERVDRLRWLAAGGLATWREVQTTGDLRACGPEREVLVRGLVRRWHRDLAVQLDGPLEHESPGPERLRALALVWLDLARATERVRALVAREATPAVQAELTAAQQPLVELFAEDLAAQGVDRPQRSAQDLLRELAAVAASEDAAGRRLPRERRALLSGDRHCSLLELVRRWVPAPAH